MGGCFRACWSCGVSDLGSCWPRQLSPHEHPIALIRIRLNANATTRNSKFARIRT
jgi:hypothetical protein